MNGWLHLRQLLSVDDEFVVKTRSYAKKHFNLTFGADNTDALVMEYSAALYNAVILFAHAAQKVLSEKGALQDGKTVTTALRKTQFQGIEGTLVALDANGDRIPSYQVMNYVIGVDHVPGSVPVGVFSTGQYTAYQCVVLWPGNTTEVPKDYVHASKIPSCGKTNGSEFYSEATQSCQPCAIGMYREPWGSPEHNDYSDDEVPRVCDSCSVRPGYSDQTGLSECKACPTHSHRPVQDH